MKLAEHLETYQRWAEEWLHPRGFTRTDIKAGVDAWTVAHKAGIYRHALSTDPQVYDAHVQTALEHIFPAAEFKDKKVY